MNKIKELKNFRKIDKYYRMVAFKTCIFPESIMIYDPSDKYIPGEVVEEIQITEDMKAVAIYDLICDIDPWNTLHKFTLKFYRDDKLVNEFVFTKYINSIRDKIFNLDGYVDNSIGSIARPTLTVSQKLFRLEHVRPKLLVNCGSSYIAKVPDESKFTNEELKSIDYISKQLDQMLVSLDPFKENKVRK